MQIDIQIGGNNSCRSDRVRPERGKGPHCTLHPDLLLPCGFLPIDAASEEEIETKLSRRTLRKRKAEDQEVDHSDKEDNISDEGQGYWVERVTEVTTKHPSCNLLKMRSLDHL